MADDGAGTERRGRRISWRWCLAGGGALFILLGIAMGIPDSAAGTGHARRQASAGHSPRHPSSRSYGPAHHRPPVTTTTANPATGLGAPLPVGSSDGTSLASSQTVPTTLPSVASLAETPPSQSVPITTTGALLLVVIGGGAFGAGWTIGRRRAIPQS